MGRVIPYLECHISDPDPETGIGEVLVRGERFAVVREREALEDLVRGESIPEELTG